MTNLHLLGVPEHAVAIDVGVAGGDALVSCQHLERGGLASSVEAQQAEALSLPHGQGEPVHRQQGLSAAVDLQWWWCGGGWSAHRVSSRTATLLPHLAELLEDEGAADHRLHHRLTL